MRRDTRWAIGLVVVGMTGLLGSATQGHTPIASRFTYNEHLFPIFERQCGRCHIEGGVGPMSLLTYQEAYPWTQSIREEVLALRMPPWKAEDGFGDFSNGHVLPAHEMDMILEWSAGGYPQGPRDQTPTAPAPSTTWEFGPPDLELTLAEPFTLDAGTSETIRYFVLPTGLANDRWITGVDVLPGSRAVVRHVSLYIDTTGQARAADEADQQPGFEGFEGAAPVAVWWPGQDLATLETAGYALPAGADIVARVVYKKTWITEGQEFSDQTHFGLYLAEGQRASIEHLVVNSPAQSGMQLLFTYTFTDEVTLYGVLPEVGIAVAELQVVGLLPDGSSDPLLLIRNPDTGWPTRYRFDAPHTLPSGSEIRVTATLQPGATTEELPSLFDSEAPVRLLLDVTTETVAD